MKATPKDHLVCCLGLVAAYLAACFLAADNPSRREASAAPVPPAPKLTPELLAGGCGWRYDYEGSWRGRDRWTGTIFFNADGTYCAVGAEEGEPLYVGTWTVEGSQIDLREAPFSLETRELGGAYSYTLKLSTAKYPRLEGQTGSVRGALTRIKP